MFYQGSISKVEFLVEKFLWQERMIKNLEEEQDFLLSQIQGGGRRKQESNFGEMYNFVPWLSYIWNIVA